MLESAEKFCQIVVSEGLTVTPMATMSPPIPRTDAFGHAQLGGAGEFIKSLVEANLPGVKARISVPGLSAARRLALGLENRRR